MMHIDFPVDVICFWQNLGNVNHLVELKSCTCNLNIPLRNWRQNGTYQKNATMATWMVLLLFWAFQFEKSDTEMKSSKRSPTGVWHRTCIACFDLKTLGKTLRSITSDTQRLFENVVFLLFGSSMSSKDMAFTGWGKNVWQSVCVLVSWSCRPVSAITTGNDWLFTLKSLQFFIILTISGDARHQTNSSPIHKHTPRHWHTRTAVALHSPSGALYSEPCHQMPLRMQNKRLLA